MDLIRNSGLDPIPDRLLVQLEDLGGLGNGEIVVGGRHDLTLREQLV
jgi:hypothetical protein